MRDLVTGGPPRTEVVRRALYRAWSLGTKTALLAVIFVAVPIFLYVEFRNAYEESQELLLRSVRDEGRVITQSLLPLLAEADTGSLPELGQHLSRFAGEVTTIKLLLAPTGTDSFYYVASWPVVEPRNLQAERDTLVRQHVLDRLAENCEGEIPFSLIYPRPTGGAEVVTAVTPVGTAAGCWAVVASFSKDAFPSAHLGEPYWATPTIQVAAGIYLAMAAITFSTLLSVRVGLRRFARRARRIRDEGPDAGSFTGRSGLPELAEVADEFDDMVDSLHRSAADIRRAAEDNAHAFKTPIAVIRQSLEPLRRALTPENQRAQRAIGVVERAVDRLDGLVSSARRLDEAAADLLAKPRSPIDLCRLIGRLIQIRSDLLATREFTVPPIRRELSNRPVDRDLPTVTANRNTAIAPASRDVTITADLSPGLFVLGSEETIEIVLENLIDNAASFSPPSGEVEVRLTREGRFAHLTISDSGPGVPEDQIERIFERYYSERHEATGEAEVSYFGIGLSIARHNVESMGGTIVAENRKPHGLTVHIRLPLAASRG